jgi:glyoxylase-like metal-dependent hydrolase (beta-lactamase superfamily II)
MVKIYEDSNDQHARRTCIYVKTGNAYAYSDAATTEKIDAATLKDLFLKGAVIIDTGMHYDPTSFKIVVDGLSSVGSITYIKADNTTPTTAVLTVLYSSEYVAG